MANYTTANFRLNPEINWFSFLGRECINRGFISRVTCLCIIEIALVSSL